MNAHCDRTARLGQLRRVLTSAALLGFVTLGTHFVKAEDTNVIRVEEDWELEVKQPDPDTQGPQVTCVTSPNGNVDGFFAAFNLNHRPLPEYQAGGLQLQLWHGEDALANWKVSGGLLSQNNEQVRWTTQMTVENGELTFAVVAGSSATWGGFGGDSLRGSLPTELTNLNSYNPDVSVQNSGVGYAGNRVISLVLRAVRLYSKDGLLVEDTQPKQVYPHD